MNQRRVLVATPEIFPFVKTGGLGDVSASLPPALAEAGIDVRLVLPGYAEICTALTGRKIIKKFDNLYGVTDACLVLGKLAGLKTYVLESPAFFSGRPGPYVDSDGKDWPDNHLRFAAFCRIAADLDRFDPQWQAEVVHGHDWPCGLIPAFLTAREGKKPASVFTIHNLAYQGLFPQETFEQLGLPRTFYAPDGLEFWQQVSYMKAGIYYADHITTVSPTYAGEIQTAEYGCGLEGLLAHKRGQLSGILNGMNMAAWDPASDSHVKFSYTIQQPVPKAKNKQALLAEFSLEGGKGMLFGVVSRLTHQKGLDILLEALPHYLEENAQTRIVILGAGDKSLEKAFLTLAAKYPARVGVRMGYDEALAHRIQAGCDSIIIPSRFEPCGLVQMYALRYGALPVARDTGGLADTIIEDETGFLFTRPDALSLTRALRRAQRAYQSPAVWQEMQRTAMEQDLGWGGAAQKYAELFDSLAQGISL